MPINMKRLKGLILIFLFSCQNKPQAKATVLKVVDTIQTNTQRNTVEKDTTQLEEFFVDSLNIGRKQLNKIEISKYRAVDSNYVVTKFYSKQKNKWVLKSEFQFWKDGIIGLDTKLSDFNNDGFKDLTYISAVAARGANEVRRLFIYDKHRDQLICMKNSESYPNMIYNRELNCIDAFLVYGGCSTVFLNISGDSLKEFASVELYEGLTVRVYDNKGKEKIIYRDTTNKAGYIRYKNFRPLKEYDAY
jgi:hypothetical protein